MVEELVRQGVTTFFVAPGSRSTPLTTAAARHPDSRVVLHVDERGTAFAALGWGRASGTPAAWITTSGTAVANGHPAVVEASVDGVPMVLLTADRPPELRDTGANQTIDQVKFFGEYVRWHGDVPPPTEEVDPAYVLTTVDQAVHHAQRAPSGPVHVNCGFRKPLEPVEEHMSVSIPDPVQAWADRTTPYTTYPTPVLRPSDPDLDSLVDAIDGIKRGLVVAGRLDSEDDANAVRRLARHLGWPLVPDLTSRLRLGPEDGAVRIAYADLVLTSDGFRQHQSPSAVLQVGGRFTSKRLRQYLRDSAPTVRAVIRADPSRVDPDHRATHHVESHISPFVERFTTRVQASGGSMPWRTSWSEGQKCAADVVASHADEGRCTEPTVATLLTRHLPSDHALVAASSMPVRDLNRHASTTGGKGPVFANRGASGIDGTVATAAGVAHARSTPVTLLIGDLALWHDLNSLALLRDLPVVVVVMNNDGGGIFHFLPIREYDEVFEPYFTTPQGRSFESAASTFDLVYHKISAGDDFQEVYEQACRTSRPTLIEVESDREANRQVHEQLEREVGAAVEARMSEIRIAPAE